MRTQLDTYTATVLPCDKGWAVQIFDRETASRVDRDNAGGTHYEDSPESARAWVRCQLKELAPEAYEQYGLYWDE